VGVATIFWIGVRALRARDRLVEGDCSRCTCQSGLPSADEDPGAEADDCSTSGITSSIDRLELAPADSSQCVHMVAIEPDHRLGFGYGSAVGVAHEAPGLWQNASGLRGDAVEARPADPSACRCRPRPSHSRHRSRGSRARSQPALRLDEPRIERQSALGTAYRLSIASREGGLYNAARPRAYSPSRRERSVGRAASAPISSS